jgi:hypothetical protein
MTDKAVWSDASKITLRSTGATHIGDGDQYIKEFTDGSHGQVTDLIMDSVDFIPIQGALHKNNEGVNNDGIYIIFKNRGDDVWLGYASKDVLNARDRVQIRKFAKGQGVSMKVLNDAEHMLDASETWNRNVIISIDGGSCYKTQPCDAARYQTSFSYGMLMGVITMTAKLQKFVEQEAATPYPVLPYGCAKEGEVDFDLFFYAVGSQPAVEFLVQDVIPGRSSGFTGPVIPIAVYAREPKREGYCDADLTKSDPVNIMEVQVLGQVFEWDPNWPHDVDAIASAEDPSHADSDEASTPLLI